MGTRGCRTFFSLGNGFYFYQKIMQTLVQNTKRTQRFWAILIAVLVVVGGGVAWQLSSSDQSTDTTINTVTATIATTLVINGGGLDMNLPVTVDAGQTAYDQIVKAASENGFVADMSEYAGKPFLNAINGISSEGYYWSFLVNGEEAQVGIGDYTLKAGDTVTLEYKTY